MRRYLFDPYEVTGLWTIAGSNLEPQFGVLRFDSKSGPHVDLEWLPKGQASEWLRTAGLGTVTVTSDPDTSQAVTLGNCLVLPSVERDGRACVELRSTMAYLGMVEADPSSVQFSEASFTATHLSSWCPTFTGFPDSSQPDMDVDTLDRWVASIRYRQPDGILVEMPDATLRIGMAFATHPRRRSAEITEYPEVHVALKEPCDCESFLSDYVYPIRDLLTFATTASCTVDSCTLVRARMDGDDEAAEWQRWVDLLHVPAEPDRPDRDLLGPEMLFSFEDMEDRVTDVIQRWIALHRVARFPMSLYFGTRRQQNSYLEAQFLAVVQAYEALDRRIGDTAADTDGAQAFAKRVLEAAANNLNETDLERLEAALVFRRQASLHDRVEALAGDDSAIARTMLRDPSAFARSVVKTRNYFTHGTDSHWAVKDLKELYMLTQVLDYLFQDRLLRELGFEADSRSELFRRNLRFSNGRFRW